MKYFRPDLLARAILAAGAAMASPGVFAGADIWSSGEDKLTFNLDVAAASFQGEDSYFGESKSFLGEPTNQWGEFGVEPRLSLEMGLGGGTLFGQVSGVYTATISDDASGLTIHNGDSDDAQVEQGHLGWKTGELFGEGYTTSFSVGRQDYKIGSGMLLADGGSDGGDHGGWYLGMRKAFMESAIARVEGNNLLLEGFRVENRPRRGGTRGEAYGVNGEYTFFDTTKLGATYMVVDAEIPGFDDLDVYDGRIDWTGKGGFGLSGEFAHEDSDQIEADGWFAEASWKSEDICWTPTFSYRYAHFDGDDLSTPKDEQFREVAYGFSDYGSWFQGEITGGYPLANGNLISQRFRVKMQASESVTLNVMYYDFTLDQDQVWYVPVGSDDWGQELNFTVDWAATEQIYVIGVLGVLQPGDAATQYVSPASDPEAADKDWVYSMIYVSYAY